MSPVGGCEVKQSMAVSVKAPRPTAGCLDAALESKDGHNHGHKHQQRIPFSSSLAFPRPNARR
jgi:hypothetical protein